MDTISPPRQSMVDWTEEILRKDGRSMRKEIACVTLAAAVYMIWQERNQRIYQKKNRTEELLARAIQSLVRLRICYLANTYTKYRKCIDFIE